MSPKVVVIGRHNSLQKWVRNGWREVSNMHIGHGVFIFSIEKRSEKPKGNVWKTQSEKSRLHTKAQR